MNEKDLLKVIQGISHKTGYKRTGDDAAVIGHTVVSTDQFIEGTHFTWDQMSPLEIGYKAVVQALSDLAAMGARPKAVLASLAWPPAEQERILAVFKGIGVACMDYGVPLAGGDISACRELTYMDFTVIGETIHPIEKKGAKPGQLLVLSGPLGLAEAGRRALKDNLNYPNLKLAFIKPTAQIDLARRLCNMNIITTLTDVSDSLSKSVHQISEHSGCGFEIDYKKLPMHPELLRFCTEQKLDIKDFLFNAGEDYQLLMTMITGASEKMITDLGLIPIGYAVEGDASKDNQVTYTQEGKTLPLTEVGWDPFNL